jgi:putative membrane protein
MSVSDLPLLNAILNATSGFLLVVGHRFIRKGRTRSHKRTMISVLVTSVLFLFSYLTYHYFHGSEHFQGQGIVRPIYFLILGTHTLLAGLIVPLALITVTRGLKGEFQQHKRIARWTYPIWLYVSVTGVIIYLMLYQVYAVRPTG